MSPGPATRPYHGIAYRFTVFPLETVSKGKPALPWIQCCPSTSSPPELCEALDHCQHCACVCVCVCVCVCACVCVCVCNTLGTCTLWVKFVTVVNPHQQELLHWLVYHVALLQCHSMYPVTVTVTYRALT